MKRDTSIQDVLFDVDQVPVEALISANGQTRHIHIPGKKALVNRRTGLVLGVVSRDYRVVTNLEAVSLAQEVCGKAFPGLSSVEWEAKRASAPRTLTYANIDLMHRTHVLNYMGSEIGTSDPYTPFLRVTNSFNGARALRFDIGFMREHCSNGVIFEEEVATIKASHSKEALAQLQIEITGRSLPQMWDEFSKFLTTVRSISMTTDQSTLALKTVLHLPDPKPEDRPARKEALHALTADFATRLTGYRQELGENAYAVFNTLTDIAARPPEITCFQTTRDTIERRSGRWLKDLARQSKLADFDLDRWITDWEATGSSKSRPNAN
ncbi:MAG: DUF932 domain-containing protein [Verrucomicrobiaceae bacterium]